jgi:hypothetical protein
MVQDDVLEVIRARETAAPDAMVLEVVPDQFIRPSPADRMNTRPATHSAEERNFFEQCLHRMACAR